MRSPVRPCDQVRGSMYVTELQIKAAVFSASSPTHSFYLKELLMNYSY